MEAQLTSPNFNLQERNALVAERHLIHGSP
jgi:hypothetical protein